MTDTLIVIGSLVISVPIMVYFTVKLAVVAFYRARESQQRKKGNSNGDEA